MTKLYVYYNPLQGSHPYNTAYSPIEGLEPIRIINPEDIGSDYHGEENYALQRLADLIDSYKGPLNCLDHLIFGEEE